MSESTITIPKAEFDRLVAEIAALKEEIHLLKNGRDSGTSSTPPSQGLGRSNARSLREKSGKPVGGQKGHRGCNLALSDAPDVVIPLTPTHCRDCGAGITTLISNKYEVFGRYNQRLWDGGHSSTFTVGVGVKF